MLKQTSSAAPLRASACKLATSRDRGQHHSSAYLNELIGDYKPQRNLRSSSSCQMQQPLVKLSFCDRAFSVAAPRIWNNLTAHIKSAETVNVFESGLKTELFTVAYGC